MPKKHKEEIKSESEKEESEVESESDEDEDKAAKKKLDNKMRMKLKEKILQWIEYDDKIKLLASKNKKYKEAKNAQELQIMKLINFLGLDEEKLDIRDDSKNVKCRVYQQKSISKGSIKEDIVKDALMEVIKDENRVSQLVSKIENKRPINERIYLKRTKGTK